MTIHDYAPVYKLWQETEGLSLEESDSKEAIEIYLRRNRGLCFVACDAGKIIGTVLCGHEGRRGILRHLAVRKDHRHAGIGRLLIQRCLNALGVAGIKKCNIFVLDENVEGRRFWEHVGWHVLEDNFRILQIAAEKD